MVLLGHIQTAISECLYYNYNTIIKKKRIEMGNGFTMGCGHGHAILK